MASALGRGVHWLRSLSDITHHGMVLGLTAAALPLMQTLPPTSMAAVTMGAVGTQLGTQVWVANIAGPTMFLNMNRRQFGDIQARLFPKFGMVGMATGLVALTSYGLAHPTPDTLTYLLAGSAASHILQSFVVIPITTKYQYELRACEEGSAEKKSAGMKFGMFHSASVLMAYAAMGINIYFFYKIGTAIGDSW